MVLTPVAIQTAIERGLCVYTHQTISGTIPPIEATGGEPIYGYISPPNWAYAWRVFALIWGALDPAGISDRFVVEHWSPTVAKHEDPWIHSLCDVEYPLHDILFRGQRHEFLIYNRTGVSQTFDITFHMVEFRSEDSWNQYRALVEEMKSLLTVAREELEIMRRMGRLV